MNFTTIFLASLAAGVIFAALAVWLTTTRGNTISDILKSGDLKDVESIRIEILDKVKLSSAIPIVALYVVAAVVAVGVPLFVYWSSHRDGSRVFFLSGSVQPAGGRTASDVFLRSPDSVVNVENPFFSLPIVFETNKPVLLTLWGPDYEPVPMQVVYDSVAETLRVQFLERGESVPVRERRATLSQPIPLTLLTANEAPERKPSEKPLVSPALAEAQPPMEGGQ